MILSSDFYPQERQEGKLSKKQTKKEDTQVIMEMTSLCQSGVTQGMFSSTQNLLDVRIN